MLRGCWLGHADQTAYRNKEVSMPEFLDLRADNPLRPADWQWQLAEFAVEHNLRIGRSQQAPYTIRAMRLIRDQRRVQTERQAWQLTIDFADLYRAWCIYARTSFQVLRHELEARLVTQTTIAEMARKTGLSETTITDYAGLFFDVRDRRDQPTLMHQLLRAGADEAVNWDEVVGWKLLAYHFGSLVVDWLTLEPALPLVRTADDLQRHAPLEFKNRLAAQALLALTSGKAGERQAQQTIANFFAALKQAEAAGVGTGHSGFAAGIQAFLENLPWTRSAAMANKHQLIAELEKNGVSLRADELMLVAAGQMPPGLQELLASAVYPPRERQTTVST
jgi:hypothetical protein